jgi:hypothetical protein
VILITIFNFCRWVSNRLIYIESRGFCLGSPPNFFFISEIYANDWLVNYIVWYHAGIDWLIDWLIDWVIDWLIEWCLMSSEQLFSYIQDASPMLNNFLSWRPSWISDRQKLLFKGPYKEHNNQERILTHIFSNRLLKA